MLFLKRSQGKALRFKAHMTIFFSLTFALVMVLLGVLIDSASIQMEKSEKRIDTTLALESVFAEYDTKLMEKYHIFARRGADERTISNRLFYYGAKNMEHAIQSSQVLTDDGGRAFYLQAVAYEKSKYGMEEGVGRQDAFDSEEAYEEEMEAFLFSDAFDFGEGENPLKPLQDLKNRSLCSLTMPKDRSVSEKHLETANLASVRTLQEGKGTFEDGKEIYVSDVFFFLRYLQEHFGHACKIQEEAKLSYEQEYLLCGKDSDRENLEQVLGNIANLRMVVNYAYLMTDATRQTEAKAMAAVISSLMLQPAATEVVKHGLLLLWAYGESVLDLRVLLRGEKVPAIKSDASWQLQLKNLIKLGTDEEVEEEKAQEEGMSYEQYLSGLLLLEDKETLAMRCIDLIESNLEQKADEYLTGVEIWSRMRLRYQVQETFITKRMYDS